LYTYDVGKYFKFAKYHIYADDLQIYIHCKPSHVDEYVEKINQDIVRLVNWTCKHGLRLNSLKTQAMIITNVASFIVSDCKMVTVNSIPIPYSTKVKNLGLILDDKLSWSPQVSAVCQKVYYIFRLYKFRSLTPQSTRIKLVSCLVLPLFYYCLFVCCNMDEGCTNRLQVAMNNAVRYIFDVPRRGHVTPYYKKLGLKSVIDGRFKFVS
jgi:hypothetical protein